MSTAARTQKIFGPRRSLGARRSGGLPHWQGLAGSLRAVADELRSGASLPQAMASLPVSSESPLGPVAAALAGGQPLVASLRDYAATTSDRDLASALGVLAVHAEAGGDPLPAISALADRTDERAAARREAAALTTQARLGARVLVLGGPAFLLLVLAADPSAVSSVLGDGGTRTLVGGGVVLQVVGALWISAIVGSVGGRPRWAGRPVLRVIYAILAGRPRASQAEVASAAESMAFALDAGLSSPAALAAAAPYAGGEVGEAMRRAVGTAGVAVHQALEDATSDQDSIGVARLCAAMRASFVMGVPLAPALRRLASDLRRAELAALHTDVRRATIRVLVPMGTLLLPAFVLICLVPLLLTGLQGITG